MVSLVVYYEGSDSVKDWVIGLLGITPTFKKMPSRNDSQDYADLPAHISDILYLDKPDLIFSMIHDRHEKPLLSIEFASCTPQYQHALQRFSRMLASVTTGCPSILIMPSKKTSNDGSSTYTRSNAVEYGAVRLMDIYRTPAFVIDWPETDGFLDNEDRTEYPLLNSPQIQKIKELFEACVTSRNDVDYSASLSQQKIVKELTDQNRTHAYKKGVPSISNPSGGEGASAVRLELRNTADLIDSIKNLSRHHKALCINTTEFILNRDESLVFFPSRITAHAGDPYVGMISYYDIAFTRYGKSTRERHYNLVAYAEGVSISEVTEKMNQFHDQKCPFSSQEVVRKNSKQYSYHLKYGCKETKVKPIRIYAELADIIVFQDGVLFNAG